MIKRTILTAKQGGIRDFIVVVGFRGREIQEALSQDHSLGVRLHFVENHAWKKANGVSLLSAKPFVKGDFLLMMADHIFVPDAIKKIRMASLHDAKIRLGIDRDLEAIFDVDDATKVQVTEEGYIQDIGKGLSRYNAYDTGLFACSEDIFETLEDLYHNNDDASLSDAVRVMASQGLAATTDLTGHFWQDVDTPESLCYAEKQLYRQLAKPTDGWIAKNINRRISLFFTRLLLKTRLSASHVTGFVTLIGIFSGIFVASGRYPGVLIGGLLFNLASILDGCDGEMARFKLSSSKTGEWLDTISDNLTYLAFFLGVAVGAHHQTPASHVVLISTLMFIGILLSLGIMFYYLIRYTNSGSLVSVQSDIEEEDRRKGSGGASSWITKLKFVMKRDFFAMFFMALAMLNQLHLILYLAVIGANLTWIVVLAYKREIFKVPEAKVLEINR